MRQGGYLIAVSAPLWLGSCALPGEPVKACRDAVNVYFTGGIDQLGLEALDATLLAVATLEACPAARATVTGHIDGAEIGMPHLGLARAANVRSVMVKRGVAGARIVVRDAAFAQPALPTPPGVPEPKNRFVAIAWK